MSAEYNRSIADHKPGRRDAWATGYGMFCFDAVSPFLYVDCTLCHTIRSCGASLLLRPDSAVIGAR